MVEDDPSLREFYRATLSAAGYGVLAVEDGMGALRWLDEGVVPQAIVLDLCLPRVSGRDVHRELKAQHTTNRVPIIVVSGTDLADLDTSEFACVLRKPVTSKELLEAVENCLR